MRSPASLFPSGGSIRSVLVLSALALAPLLLAGIGASSCISRKAASVAASGNLRIVSLTADPDTVYINEQSLLTAQIDNPSGRPLTYSWTAYRGALTAEGPQARYYGSYCCAGTDFVVLTVRNDRDEAATRLLTMTVFQTER